MTVPSTEGFGAAATTVGLGYDTADHQNVTVYPAKGDLATVETVTTSYNRVGLPTVTNSAGLPGGAAGYVASTSYDDVGRLVGREQGSVNKLVRGYSYQPDSGRLGQMTASVAGVAWQNDTFSYDPAGNVKSVDDQARADSVAAVHNQKQCFNYDSRNRLTRAFTTKAACNWAVPNPDLAVAATNIAPYSYGYVYSSIGNVSTVTDTAGTARTYCYNPSGGGAGSKPHAVHHVTTAACTAGDAYGYNANGQLDASIIGGGATTTLVWNPEGTLASVTKAGQVTSMVYGPDGQRLIRREA